MVLIELTRNDPRTITVFVARLYCALLSDVIALLSSWIPRRRADDLYGRVLQLLLIVCGRAERRRLRSHADGRHVTSRYVNR